MIDFTQIEKNWPIYVEKIIAIILILVLARIASHLIQKLILRLYNRKANSMTENKQKRANTACSIIQSLSKYVVWFFAIVSIIGQLGLSATMNSLLATAGIGGLAIGFGAQSIIKDVFTGLFMIFEDQIAVGDYVQIGDITGFVEEISLRNTVIKGARGELNVIPNGNISIVTNYSREDYLAQVDVSIAYEADVVRAMRLMLEEAEQYAKQTDIVTDKPNMLGVETLGNSGVTLRMRVRVKPLEHWQCERDLNQRIKARFEREGIEIPYQKLVLLTSASDKGESA